MYKIRLNQIKYVFNYKFFGGFENDLNIILEYIRLIHIECALHFGIAKSSVFLG